MSKKAKPKTKPRTTPPAGGASRFWPGLVLGAVLAAAAAHFGPSLLRDDSQKSGGGNTGTTASSKTKTTKTSQNNGQDPREDTMKKSPASTPPASSTHDAPSSSKATTGPLTFRDPARAADLLTRLGMGESYPGSLLWKNSDSLGWNAFGVIATSGSPVSTNAGAGNSVTCLMESKRPDQVEVLRLIANIYQPKAEEATVAKFRSLALAVLTETRCPGTREFLEAIDGRLALQTSSSDTRFTLSQSPLAPGARWELVVEAR